MVALGLPWIGKAQKVKVLDLSAGCHAQQAAIVVGGTRSGSDDTMKRTGRRGASVLVAALTVASLGGHADAAVRGPCPAKVPRPVPSRQSCRGAGSARSATPTSAAALASGKLTTDSDGLHYKGPDGTPKLNLSGLLQVDGGGAGYAALREGDPAHRALARRGRLQIGAIDGDETFDAQIDTFNRQLPIGDLDVGYTGLKDAVLTLGQIKQPFSFEFAQSSPDLTFLERSLAFALTPGRAFGGGVSYAKDKFTAVAGVFGGNLNQAVAGAEGAGFATRVTYDPLLEKDHVLHFGFSTAYRARDAATPIAFATTPQSVVSDLTVLKTGPLEGIASLTRGGLEFAYLDKAFRMQGEVIALQGDRLVGGHVTYVGGYIQAAYFLTGQVELYSAVPSTKRRDVGYATFGGIDLADKDEVSNGGIGAVEIAARYSVLDLGPVDGGQGGRVQDVSAGVNWYPQKNLKLMLDYDHAFENRLLDGRKAPDANIIQGRFQLFY